jgi:hypothetical protein
MNVCTSSKKLRASSGFGSGGSWALSKQLRRQPQNSYGQAFVVQDQTTWVKPICQRQ